MVIKVARRSDLYTYRVTWSKEDNQYVGLCAEFPSLSWLADTQEDALRGINGVVVEVIPDMETNGEVIPQPLAIKYFSGKFTVRLTSDVHRRLAIQAAEAGVSVNRYVSARLAAV